MTKKSTVQESSEKEYGLLSSEERDIFNRIAAKEAPYSQRAQALLALGEGATQAEAAHQAGLTQGQVHYWLAKFRRDGMDIFPEELLNQAVPLTQDDAPDGQDLEQSQDEGDAQSKMLDAEETTKPLDDETAQAEKRAKSKKKSKKKPKKKPKKVKKAKKEKKPKKKSKKNKSPKARSKGQVRQEEAKQLVMGFDTNLQVKIPKEYGQDQLDRFLAGKFAFAADPPVAEKWTFYDTFDWRLFNKSLVLRHAGQMIVLDNLSSGESLNGLTTDSAPKFAWDLPESPLRKRLESIIKMRALLPLVEVDTRFILYRILNDDQKTVARLVYSEVQTVDEDK